MPSFVFPDAISGVRNAIFVGMAAVFGAVIEIHLQLTFLVTPLVIILVWVSLQDYNNINVGREMVSPIAWGIIISYIGLPIISLIIGRLVLSDWALQGVVVMVAGPATVGSALVWTRLGKGDVGVTLAISGITLILAPAITPVLVATLLSTQVEIPTLSIFSELIVILTGGVLLKVILPEGDWNVHWNDQISIVVILILVFISVNSGNYVNNPSDVILWISLATVLITFTALILTEILSRFAGFTLQQKRGVFYAATMKNLGVGILISTLLPISGAVIAVTTFYITQQIISSLLAERW